MIGTERRIMADGFQSVIAQLEHRKAAIENALEALQSIDGGAPGQAPSQIAPREGGMTPEGKQRLIAALKRRWAAKKRAAKKAAAASTLALASAAPAKRKGGGMTPEGRRRLAEAMTRRWAVKRAASAVKHAGRKKAA
jgi:hypothetical protein